MVDALQFLENITKKKELVSLSGAIFNGRFTHMLCFGENFLL